jgi:CRISPR-associated endonuclease/helicase Cas3
MDYFAHIKKEDNGFKTQTLLNHLTETSNKSAEFAGMFNDSEWGRLLGLWHDLGKFSVEFQDYIRINSGYEENDQNKPKTDHTSAGAIFSKELLPQKWPPFAYCIAGHHAGLHNWYPEIGLSGDLSDRLKKHELLDKIRSFIPKEITEMNHLNPPAGRPLPPEQIHLWIRMLFSCLVDADYLDTEHFMNPESFAKRGKYNTVRELKVLFDNYMEELGRNAPITEVNLIRNRILKQCIQSGEKDPGFFSITVPTGGGKTLSAMAWALEHATIFNKSRIIFAIPYTSIITQTAQVYRDIFGDTNVIEHHSNIDEEADFQDRKLAIENWDAPIIVTTNVQLFESLFSNKTSRCRKLHNLVNSIIILDEAQMLPPEFLNPILSILKGLVEIFGVSVLFSTATQPALNGTIGSGQNAFKGIENNTVREIVPDYLQLTNNLKRVKIEMPVNTNQPTEWNTIADELKDFDQVLCIVNTRKDCHELYKLMPEGTFHLSRMMCSDHIMDTIAEIKQRLKDGKHVTVISTQLIEAGVDVDFPVVYRALAGLDSVAQSAGRCNREGKLNYEGKLGLTKVFCTVKGTPPGLMRKGSDTLKELLHLHAENDFLDPTVFRQYFSLFYSKVHDFDKPKIEDLLVKDATEMKFQFATSARDFRLIDDKGAQSILVKYREGSDLINLLKRKGPETWLMRKLQHYTVSVNARDFDSIRKAGLIEEMHGCWIQSYEKLYDSKAGLMRNDEWLEEIHII